MDLLHNARKDWLKIALEEQGMEDSKIGGFLFNTVDVQKVAIELIQGTGRLLRTTSDFGAVVFLDPRMHPGAKPYTSSLRKLLPYPSLGTKEDILKVLGIFAGLAEKERRANADLESARD
jgi:Rad3-related DNA helicase